MCRVDNFLDPNLVISDIDVSDRKELINKLAAIIEKYKGLDAKKICDAIWEREQYGTTGIGNGVAIPHGRIKGLKDIILLLATTRTPVDYNSIDGEGVSLVFMLVVPEGNNLVYLKLLSQISIMCNDKSTRTKLISAKTKEDLIHVVGGIY